MEGLEGLWVHLPPVALLLVQLQLILVNIELLHQGNTVVAGLRRVVDTAF